MAKRRSDGPSTKDADAAGASQGLRIVPNPLAVPEEGSRFVAQLEAWVRELEEEVERIRKL